MSQEKNYIEFRVPTESSGFQANGAVDSRLRPVGENSELFVDLVRSSAYTSEQITEFIRLQDAETKAAEFRSRRLQEKLARVDAAADRLQTTHLNLCDVHKTLYTLCWAFFVVFFVQCVLLVLSGVLLFYRVDSLERQLQPLLPVPSATILESTLSSS